MPSLRELQQAFVDGTLHGDTTSIAAQIEPNGIAPERRLAIYRNNAVEGFLKTLEATFPVLVQLAGADWFRQTGRGYMRRHPSRSGNLHYVGERFAAFLADELANSEYEYFADVARLEWAYQEVLVAAEHPSMDVSALATVSPNDYDALIFVVHPSLRLVSSSFPVLAIWKANRTDAAPSRAHPPRCRTEPPDRYSARRSCRAARAAARRLCAARSLRARRGLRGSRRRRARGRRRARSRRSPRSRRTPRHSGRFPPAIAGATAP